MPTYSYSGLQSFGQCPRKFAFKYRERVDVGRTTTVEAFLGSRAHDALEWLYQGVSLGRTPTADEVAARYRERWAAEWRSKKARYRLMSRTRSWSSLPWERGPDSTSEVAAADAHDIHRRRVGT